MGSRWGEGGYPVRLSSHQIAAVCCWFNIIIIVVVVVIVIIIITDRICASASRAEGPGFESRLRRDFFRGRVIPVT